MTRLPLLHVGLGPLGRRIVSDVHARGVGRVVAALDLDPGLAGKELDRIVPGADEGVLVRSVPGEIEDWSGIRCAIVTTSSDLELCMDVFRELLGRGCSLVSTCEELSWPWLRHPVLAQELHELGVRHGARILGTGVNPGFLMDALPVALTTACRTVRGIRVERVQDASTRRVPFQRKIGVGLEPQTFDELVATGRLRHVGLGESLHFLAHYLGLRIERWEEELEPVLAERELESGLGRVPIGSACGVRQVARAWTKGGGTIELLFHAALGEHEPHDRVQIDGEPPLELLVPGGVHGDVATSAIVVNSIRSLLAAEPGLHTMSSIPLQGCIRPTST